MPGASLLQWPCFSVIISETIGIFVGSISGFYGGWVDAILMRFVEFMLTIPTLPLLLIISSMLYEMKT